MSNLSPETFKALLALESAFGQVESVSELKAGCLSWCLTNR